VKRRIHVPVVLSTMRAHSVSQRLSEAANSRYVYLKTTFSCKIVAKVAAIKHRIVCMQKIKTIYLLVIWSILLILNLAPVEFIIILVS
jgi:hypothetical protein